MKSVICQFGETEPGTTTVTLTRGETTVAIRDVPAQICTTCGEEYVYILAQDLGYVFLHSFIAAKPAT